MAGRAEINALHEDQLLMVLERLGMAEAFIEHRLECSVCGQLVGDYGLGAIKLSEGHPIVCCGRVECLERFHG